MKRIVAGILAHVDAGKTTLSESLLFESGAIRKMGRVDHKNTVLDTDLQERGRGITIFSKQACITAFDTQITLLDTPGHVDFAAEMERTLQVLDYAILVVSGTQGVQGHTLTLWKLLERYEVPTFIFINKMDMEGADEQRVLGEFQKKLNGHFVSFAGDFAGTEEFIEQVAVSDEAVLERYLDSGVLEQEDIPWLIQKRKIFPCFFGSALKNQGIRDFLEGFCKYSVMPGEEKEFGARVFKISRDEQGNRLTHMKITGGRLSVRAELSGRNQGEDGIWSQKVNQIRIYQGAKFEAVSECVQGMVCAVTGLTETYAGEGLGISKDARGPVLQPVMTYQMLLPDGVDVAQAFPKLKALEEEEPQLELSWNEDTGEVLVKLMGEVQTEVLGNRIKERYGMQVNFGPGSIVYRETIEEKAYGVGHFEPLRHYAEVHLRLEPGEMGSGLVFESDCSEEALAKNWQRLILTHLREKEHVGVLTGAPITDMKISLVGGRAHLKHTEGGDFRQATYRAVRQGLMRAKSRLLEPFYEFVLEIPVESVGRALTDLERMGAVFEAPDIEGGQAVLRGRAPVSAMQGYQLEVVAYSKGRGALSLEFAGYMPCHNCDEVIAASGYVPELDIANPAGSVFCAHGAGYYVEWNEVEQRMHAQSEAVNAAGDMKQDEKPESRTTYASSTHARYADISYSDDKELQQIFTRTYGEKREGKNQSPKVYDYSREPVYKPVQRKKEYLLVDGYNVIHAWEELHELAQISLEAARDALMDILSNYQGYRGVQVILVFDAYKVKGNPGEVVHYHNIDVVYTKEAETADRYIEKTAHEIGHKYQVTVVTSDGVEQVIIRGAGCMLMSSREFEEDAKRVGREIGQNLEQKRQMGGRNYLFDNMEDALREKLERIRLGME